jgi:uncharacterized RDD family membrane protein YckC
MISTNIVRRGIAQLIDDLLKFGFNRLLGIVGFYSLFPNLSSVGWFLIATSIYIMYGTVLEALFSGKTVGKFLTGIRAVKENGAEFGLKAAFIRNLIEPIDGFAFYLVGLITMSTNEKEQRLGDFAADTIVINDEENLIFK